MAFRKAVMAQAALQKPGTHFLCRLIFAITWY
jgi:hypothetical protein